MSHHLREMDEREHNAEKLPEAIDCFRCGICCTRHQPPVTTDEAKDIAKGLKLSTEDFLSKYAQLTHFGYLLRHLERGCTFLSWEKDGYIARCTIHPFRPQACRDWIASLSRPECREGLTRLKTKDIIEPGKNL